MKLRRKSPKLTGDKKYWQSGICHYSQDGKQSHFKITVKYNRSLLIDSVAGVYWRVPSHLSKAIGLSDGKCVVVVGCPYMRELRLMYLPHWISKSSRLASLVSFNERTVKFSFFFVFRRSRVLGYTQIIQCVRHVTFFFHFDHQFLFTFALYPRNKIFNPFTCIPKFQKYILPTF